MKIVPVCLRQEAYMRRIISKWSLLLVLSVTILQVGLVSGRDGLKPDELRFQSLGNERQIPLLISVPKDAKG